MINLFANKSFQIQARKSIIRSRLYCAGSMICLILLDRCVLIQFTKEQSSHRIDRN